MRKNTKGSLKTDFRLPFGLGADKKMRLFCNKREIYKGEREEKYSTACAAERGELCIFISYLSSSECKGARWTEFCFFLKYNKLGVFCYGEFVGI